jgi:hypothetical protein
MAYLDTCIVSGLAKGDLGQPDVDALVKILRAHKQGLIRLVASQVVRRELEAIPASYRASHEVIYSLLTDVPTVPTHSTDSGLTLCGVGGGSVEDPVFTAIKSILPDVPDAEHVFQACKAGARYLITADRRSLTKHSASIEASCGVKVVAPTELALAEAW